MKFSLNPSVWEAEEPPSGAEPFTRTAWADVCVVGAGIAGLSTAYLLAREGRSVVVLDAGVPGGGETAHTTAHLSNAIDVRYSELARLHGEEAARLAAQSHTAAIDRIEEIVRAEKIACGFERLEGFLIAPRETGNGADGEKLLERERLAAHRAGLSGVEKREEAPIPDYDAGACLVFPGQAQFHPLRYLAGLRAALLREGGKIHGLTQVKSVTGGAKGSVRTADGKTIRAGAFVVATNTPINDVVAIHSRQTPYRTYVIAAEVPKGSVRRALFWDTLEPYHYVRIVERETDDLLLVGGEDHKTGQADDAPLRFARLERWGRERFPMMMEVLYRWSGQSVYTVDGLAFIGRNPMDEENVYIATGDCGMGMTHGTIAGMLLTDLIVGRPNPWSRLYDPARTSRGSLRELARNNLTVAARYSDYVTPGDVSGEAEIPTGGGAVLRHGLRKLAVFRDGAGVCHRFSAVCPHLKCLVHWNSLEKTWDCPCHGSRFSAAMGKVLNGPATSGLEPADRPAGSRSRLPA